MVIRLRNLKVIYQYQKRELLLQQKTVLWSGKLLMEVMNQHNGLILQHFSKEYLKKITAAAIVIAGIGIFATGVSADNKLGCVDFFDAYSQTESSVTLKWDKGINADGYSKDAAAAVKLCQRLLNMVS